MSTGSDVQTAPTADAHGEMSFFDHLDELRSRIFKALLGIVVGCIIVAFFTNEIVAELLRPAVSSNVELQNIEPFGQAFLKIKIVFIGGTVLAFPWLVWQIWGFIAPGLYAHERSWARKITFFTTVCFLIGISFSYFLLIPSMMAYMNVVADPNIKDSIAISYYFSFFTNMLLAGGLIFELPMITWVLARVGILNPTLMVTYRRHSIVGILVIAAVITPSPDPVNQLMVAIPLYILYEISAVLARFAYAKRDQV
ncbi:MAG: twin-arginine translocase subunit TatC [Candidatus Kapabacteria bacterium]|nr:twin-arginine translocase subunit TatC [Candidatus Kapabacteria bacterium]